MSPIFADFKGFKFGWFSNEGNEPPHVHVFRGSNRSSSTKLWLYKEGITVAHNHANLKKQELSKIIEFVSCNRELFVTAWFDFFN